MSLDECVAIVSKFPSVDLRLPFVNEDTLVKTIEAVVDAVFLDGGEAVLMAVMMEPQLNQYPYLWNIFAIQYGQGRYFPFVLNNEVRQLEGVEGGSVHEQSL